MSNDQKQENKSQEEKPQAEQPQHWKVLILGTGPAGLTAALYTARANLSPLVLEGTQPGGQLTTTTEVENYPGFPEGVDGYKLITDMKAQAKRFGAEFRYEVASSVDFQKTENQPFIVHTSDKKTYSADSVIIATGAQAKYLGLENEQKLIGHGVSACATCDGFFFKDKELAVVGGGDTAMEEATFLTKFATKVTVIHRRDQLRASKIMQERAFNNPKIDFMWDTVVTDVIGSKEKGVSALKIKNVKTGAEREFPVGGLFMAIGHKPNTDPFQNQLELDDQGYILVKPGTVSTSVEGVFACGDVQDTKYKQAITAAGTGCMAAIDAEHYLEALNDSKL